MRDSGWLLLASLRAVSVGVLMAFGGFPQLGESKSTAKERDNKYYQGGGLPSKIINNKGIARLPLGVIDDE